MAVIAARGDDAPGWIVTELETPLGQIRIDGINTPQNVLYATQLGELRPFGQYVQLAVIWDQGSSLPTGSFEMTLRFELIGRDGKFGLMPHMLPGRQAHFCGDVGFSPGSFIVDRWCDQSGNDRHATCPLGQTGYMPLVFDGALNSKTCLYFDGNDILSTPAFSLSTFTIFSVFRQDTGTTAGLTYEHSADSNASDGCYLYGNNTSTVFVKRGVPSSGKNFTSSWATDGVYRIIRHEYGGTHASHLFYVNGVVPTLTSGNSNDPGIAPSTLQSLFIGARSGLVAPMTGVVAELLVYSPALSTSDAQRVEREYLSPRYGITVA